MEDGKSLGVWSTQSKSWIGSGTTRRKTISKRFWDVVELPDRTYRCTPLTSNLVAAGSDRIVSATEFHNDYKHEPDFISGGGTSTRISAGVPVQNNVERNRAPQQTHSAQTQEISAPVKLSQKELEEKEHEVRTDFGMGLTYLRMGKAEQAKEIFDAIPDKDIPWVAEHKHMFSDFGTGLRKTRLHSTALKHYRKALELSPEDEHLCHNIARVYYEIQDLDACKFWLKRSLELNPDLAPSKQFLRFLEKQAPAK